jgi:hypothetical protein
MEVIHRELARLESLATTATAAFDASSEWVSDGARNASVWLATRCRMPRPQARRLVRRGRALRHLPACAAAWSEGAVTGAHLDVLSALRREALVALLERDEAMLVDQARVLSYESFVRLVAYWEQRADPDGTEDQAEERRTRRDVYLVETFSELWLGQMTLDPVSGAIVSAELERLEKELFEQEWAETRTTLGREPTPGDLPRTTAQRRADALVEMATRARVAPVDGRRPEPLFSVLVGYEALYGRISELEDGAVLAPGTLLPWFGAADFERAVFAPGKRVEVSVTSRLFTGATRRAIALRDRTCTHPYCDLPAAQCQIDHIVPYTAGGLTTQENGRVHCGFHNRLRNGRPPPGE